MGVIEFRIEMEHISDAGMREKEKKKRLFLYENLIGIILRDLLIPSLHCGPQLKDTQLWLTVAHSNAPAVV